MILRLSLYGRSLLRVIVKLYSKFLILPPIIRFVLGFVLLFIVYVYLKDALSYPIYIVEPSGLPIPPRDRHVPQGRIEFLLPNTDLPPCITNVTGGPREVLLEELTDDQLADKYPDVEHGGHYRPKSCFTSHKVAIVIPFRERHQHLRILLNNMHGFLRKQNIDYFIFVVEQVANQTFNRAKLLNVGYLEAMKWYPWECFIVHDVDMIPENDKNLYTCPIGKFARHMSVNLDVNNYKISYWRYFGGVSAFPTDLIERMNGFPNNYWGWGGEDDDIFYRVYLAGYAVTRYPNHIARYKMIKHERDVGNEKNECRFDLLKQTKRNWTTDGLNSVKYKVISHSKRPFYTHIVVDLLEPEHEVQHGFLWNRC